MTTTSARNGGRRLDILQRAGNEFDLVPFDADAARIRGYAAVIGAGRNQGATSLIS